MLKKYKVLKYILKTCIKYKFWNITKIKNKPTTGKLVKEYYKKRLNNEITKL